jgi:hypothetical protein
MYILHFVIIWFTRSIRHQQHVCYPTFLFKSFVIRSLITNVPLLAKKKEIKTCLWSLLAMPPNDKHVRYLFAGRTRKRVIRTLHKHKYVDDVGSPQSCVLPKLPFWADLWWMMRPLVPKHLTPAQTTRGKDRACLHRSIEMTQDYLHVVSCDRAVTRVFDWPRPLLNHFFSISRYVYIKSVLVCTYM